MASKLVENVLPWVSTGLSAIGAFFGGSQQTSMNKKMMEFNSVEAEKQRNWTESLWNKQNVYNTPANQMKLLREAGLSPVNFETSISPAGAVGDGFAAQSPQLTNPYLVGSNVAANMSRADLNQSQARLTESNKKTVDAMRQGQVDLNNTQIHLNLANQNLSEREADKVYYEISMRSIQMSSLDEQIKNISAQTKNIDEDTIHKAFENEHAVEMLSKELSRLQSEIDKNHANVTLFNSQAGSSDALAKLYLREAANAVIEGKTLSWNLWYNRDKGKVELQLLRTNSEQAQFNLDWDKQYRGAKEVANAVSGLGGVITNGVLTYGLFKGLKGVNKPSGSFQNQD